ncbi:hypothetical protein LJC56_06525 [Christensenellaceae bacterium OttesenSCG-928-K19]|nr:hypothetical protein [Christensenellaceae bacterium OttesenSCG-928-K19]
MKKILMLLVAAVFIFAMGCAQQQEAAGQPTDGTQPSAGEAQQEETVQPEPPQAETAGDAQESKDVRLVREMMELDYANMTVAAFNEAIQEICEKADTNIFEVIANLYDGGLPHDRGLEVFMDTTLDYSSQQIFGEPVHLGNVMYMTLPGVTAKELAQKKAEMDTETWDVYFDENIADIQIRGTLFYEIEYGITDPKVLPVEQRDSRLNAVREGIEEFVLGMEEAEIEADTAWQAIETKLAQMTGEYSDDDMTVKCRVQNLERMEDLD